MGYASLQGPYVLQNPTGVPAGTPVLIDVHGGGASPVWSAAMQYLVTDDTTIGLTYQSGTTFNLHGTRGRQHELGRPPVFDDVSVRTTHITWPQSVAMGGVIALPAPHRRDGRDLVRLVSAFSQVGLTLQDSTNPLFPTIHESLPLNWRDSVSMKLGYEEILPIGGTCRIGYVYHPNPVPSSFLTPLLARHVHEHLHRRLWLCGAAMAGGLCLARASRAATTSATAA